MRIFYAFLNFFIFIPIHFCIFHRGYQGIVKDKSLLFIFKILIGLLAIAYLVFSILNAGAFDGWVRVAEFWNNESPNGKSQGFTGFLCFIESLAYTLNVLLMGWAIYIVQT